MEFVTRVLLVVSPVLVLVLLGYWLGVKRQYKMRTLSDLTVYLTLPCLVFASLARSPIEPSSLLKIGSAAIFVIGGTGLAVALYLRMTGKRDLRILYPTVMFVNAGNLALPLVQFAWGNGGFNKAVVFQAVSTSLMYTLGVYLVSGDRDLRKLFTLPFVYAAASGLGLSAAHLTVPGPILEIISFIGGAALPVLLVMLGFELRSIRLKDLRLALVGSGLRLGLGFALGLLFVTLISVDPLTRKIIIFDAAMPSAVGAVVLGIRFNSHPEVSASIVLVTTIISLVTIPLLLWFL
jgi:predicted permease